MDRTSFTTLLEQALTEPGTVSRAYFAFHGYSLGNQLLALMQCLQRGIQPGPIASFMHWKTLGRYVRKGERALTLCMPITRKRVDAEEIIWTQFVYRANWFVLSQTDGRDYAEVAPAVTWVRPLALERLAIQEIPFDLLDGNCQGYARNRSIAVSPIAANPLKTTFHELAHVLLGHTAEGAMSDDDRTPRSLREVEAEAVAMLCCAALELPGVEDARGYIQHWRGSREPIPERSAQRIFKVADQILKAGQEEPSCASC